MKARNYQIEAIEKTFQKWEEGFKTLIGEMATGLGKTVVFSLIIKRLGVKAIIVAHRKELINQAKNKLKEVTGLHADIEMGEFKASMNGDFFTPKADVIVTSIQTMTTGGDGSGRMTKFNPDDFGILIIDECHRAVSPSYRRFINYCRKNKNMLVFGVTATSDRSDKEALGQVFEEVAFKEYDILFGIKQGWLVPVYQQFAILGTLDISHVKTTAGELNSGELSKVLECEKPVQDMVQVIFECMHGLPPKSLSKIHPAKWAEHVIGIKPKRSIAFTRFVHHAEMLSNVLNRIKTGFAAWVCGETEDDDRDKIIGDFKKDSGCPIVCNVGILSEGYDDDGVEMIFQCCPMKSRIRYAQTIGRGTRPHKTIAHSLNNTGVAALRRSMILKSCKPKVTVIDMVGNSGKHKLISAIDILSGNVSDKTIEATIKSAKLNGRPIRVEKEVADEDERQKKAEIKRLEEEGRKAKLVAKQDYILKEINPFDALQLKPIPQRSWDNKRPPTPAMAKFLKEKMGLNPDKFTFSQAGQLIGDQKERWSQGLCNLKQANWLKSHGYPTRIKFEDAIQITSAWRQNGWRRPTSAMLPDSVTGGVKKIEVPREWEKQSNIDETISSENPF